MCRGDVSITTFGWRGGRPTAKVNSEHECINWETLAEWAGERSVDLLDVNNALTGNLEELD